MNKHPKKHHNKAHNPGVLSHKPRSTPCEPPGVQVSGLDTDLYQLTMLAAYLKSGKAKKLATFELFVRNLPPGWGYLTACGIEGALDFLEQVCFDEKQVEWLANLDVFAGVDPDVFDYLRNYRFRGDVWAMDEGTPVFAEQPILSVTAGIGDAQIVETALLSRINYETLVATKASRVVHAAAGRPVADFGSRRAHGPQAAFLAARAGFVGGCSATSNLSAGYKLGIPVTGTSAHAFIMAFEKEKSAFKAFVETYPGGTALVIDTYDPLLGARHAADFGKKVNAVRIDGGDLVTLSKEVRNLLDSLDSPEIKIFLSGDLDEYRIAEIVGASAPVDAFGVGTKLVTSWDHPALGGIYKLVEFDGRPVMKRGGEKATWPGSKQVFRECDKDGRFLRDTVGHASENNIPGTPLLCKVMENGKRIRPASDVYAARKRWFDKREKLSPDVLRLQNPDPYDVRWSSSIKEIKRKLEKEGSNL